MRALNSRPSKQTIQWNGDNLLEIESALDGYVTHASSGGGVLKIIGIGGLELAVQLGETLIIEDGRIGIIRNSSEPKAHGFVTWKGSNIEEFAAFLKGHKVRMAVAGDALLIHGGTKPIILSRGDRLIHRDGQIVVSIAGKQHQA
jgi:hypothetical protein